MPKLSKSYDIVTERLTKSLITPQLPNTGSMDIEDMVSASLMELDSKAFKRLSKDSNHEFKGLTVSILNYTYSTEQCKKQWHWK